MKAIRVNQPKITCQDPCSGVDVYHMRTGEPIVSYRQCPHGAELKRIHARMTDRQIRASMADVVKFRPSS